MNTGTVNPTYQETVNTIVGMTSEAHRILDNMLGCPSTTSEDKVPVIPPLVENIELLYKNIDILVVRLRSLAGEIGQLR